MVGGEGFKNEAKMVFPKTLQSHAFGRADSTSYGLDKFPSVPDDLTLERRRNVRGNETVEKLWEGLEPLPRPP